MSVLDDRMAEIAAQRKAEATPNYDVSKGVAGVGECSVLGWVMVIFAVAFTAATFGAVLPISIFMAVAGLFLIFMGKEEKQTIQELNEAVAQGPEEVNKAVTVGCIRPVVYIVVGMAGLVGLAYVLTGISLIALATGA